jgi:hypothetical protein
VPTVDGHRPAGFGSNAVACVACAYGGHQMVRYVAPQPTGVAGSCGVVPSRSRELDPRRHCAGLVEADAPGESRSQQRRPNIELVYVTLPM